jgi:hypothetical protein
VKVGMQSSKAFDDYTVFMRAMGVALSPLRDGDNDLTLYCAGTRKLQGFLDGFVNLTENGMVNRGMSIKLYPVAPNWMEHHVAEMDYFAYLSRPMDKWSRLTHLADEAGIETGIFQY